jgi:aminoglycoside phosphotransferase (APT) family kinase protein
VDGLVALAQATARVQAAVSALPDAERRGLPHSPVERLPEWLDELVADVGRRHPRARHVLDRLGRLRAPVGEWTAELLAGGWPDSIDHTDLHARNALIDERGLVRIVDWEEAVVGLPFFSLDRLLEDARALGASIAVRDAYLGALPWKSLRERRRALEVALALAPIKVAHECLVFWRARGRPSGNPYLTDFFALRALRRRVSAA